MGEESKAGRGIVRLLLFESLAGLGLAHILLYAPSDKPHTLVFLYNAIAFLALYPVVYFYKWVPLPGVMRFLFTPLNVLFHAILLVSTYLWLGYVVYMRWTEQLVLLSGSLFVFWMFWAVLYLSWFRYVLGASQKYIPLGPLLALTLIVACGGCAGFFAGQWVVGHYGEHVGSDSLRFVVWTMLVMVGMMAGAVFAPKGGSRQD